MRTPMYVLLNSHSNILQIAISIVRTHDRKLVSAKFVFYNFLSFKDIQSDFTSKKSILFQTFAEKVRNYCHLYQNFLMEQGRFNFFRR